MHTHKHKKYLAIIIITIFTIIMVFPFSLIKQLGVCSDWSFHAARVQQLYLNLQKGHLFTYIATDTFSKIGNANFLFYPTVFLYPWVLLKFIFSPVTAYLIYVWLLFLATGLIAFYAMYSFTNGKTRQSLFFAIIYLTAPYHLYLTLTNYVLGEAQAYTFIPLVLLGIWNILYRNGWITLAVAMTLMAYSHYVSTFISFEVCLLILICYLIQNHKIELHKFTALFKSVCLFFLLSSWQFIPLFTDYLHGNLMLPASGFMAVQSAGDFFTTAISNNATNQGGIGILLLMTLMFGWLFIEKESKYMWIYLLGLVITWMITAAFPWQYFAKTPLSIIQFPYRYTSYAIVFLAIISAKILSELKYPSINNNVTECAILLLLVFLFTGSIYSDIARNKNIGNTVSVLKEARKGKYKPLRDASDGPLIVTNESYNNQFSYGALYGETDYMPTSAFKNLYSVFNRVVLINGKDTTVYQKSSPNKLTYTLHVNNNSIVNLPALAYRHTIVTVNGKIVKSSISNRGTVQLSLEKGKYYIGISYKPVKMLIVARLIALIGWIAIVLNSVLKYFEIGVKQR